MEWLSDFGHWVLISQGGLMVGTLLLWAGLVTGGCYLLWRYGDVQMGTDPPPPPAPPQIGDIAYVWETEPPAAANYHRSEDAETDVFPVVMDEFYPLAEHFGARVDAVTEVIEQVITRTTELVITIPEPESLYPARHRVEDLYGDTRPLGEAIRRAKELAP